MAPQTPVEAVSVGPGASFGIFAAASCRDSPCTTGNNSAAACRSPRLAAFEKLRDQRHGTGESMSSLTIVGNTAQASM